ncbi:DUF2608 domain-containing protein [Sansalvadorimonas verongulae]|uniref:DUF2608 domain-containing protein n=1 Tax=Sansalvadorimonas verongulae TaxID=2172824 RepID=UPI0012BC0794|nr:DUF2608 domain-containing protein [Sansalvadorimonas verongulae]MTI13147.1 DUF2608 domain-containing protein [Sansalvadorimonas verongulae]
MHTTLKTVIGAAVLTMSTASFADVSVMKTDNYKAVDKVFQQVDQKYGAKNVLAVFDIDNTILTTGESDLGGDIWYQWQTGKLDVKPKSDQKVSCLYSDTLALLFELMPMKTTEDGAVELLKSLNNRGQTVMALSSRSPMYRVATERELHSHKFDFSKNALAPAGSTVAPTYAKTFKRPTEYKHGVALTTGTNKGDYLEYILDTTGRKFDAIVFVDDGERNIEAMKKKFSSSKYKSMDVRLVNYTKVIDDRIKQNGTVLTQEQADKMADDWDKLVNTLNSIYPERARGCLAR